MHYLHVDVFTGLPYSGNSLAVFPDAGGLSGDQMQRIAQELRHFESVFLTPDEPPESSAWRARVFDLFEELDFAGHPVIGAACVLHALHGAGERETWTLRLKARTVEVSTEQRGPGRYASVLDQGPASFLGCPDPVDAQDLAAWFGLDAADLDPELPPEVVSTGLRYLVLPVRQGVLERARIGADISGRLAGLGAQFAYVLDATALEARHWNNDGLTEDVATGSGAGCAAAYLRRHGRIGDGEAVTLHQGRFTGRPSEMTISTHGHGEDIHSVRVGGEVAFVGEGRLEVLPR
ncbi:PhzF family phenazine biosynthesis protein [Streptomyces sp. NPDC057557]|uniref:PhzF family phenazine biosynthesis protein n=1 Tax=Streptomyces sp. NPDC057557 TaxID=3346167 RepID=UPI00367EC1B8